MTRWDVIVVGAGPAGAVLGYELGRMGIRALLLEKCALPRYKACGGGLNFKTVNSLGFDISPVVENTVTGAHVTFRMGNRFTKTWDHPLTLTTSRDKFDHFLVQKAQETGCALHEQERVDRVDIQPGGVTVYSSGGRYTAELVVGADGANGIVARSAGLAPDPFLGVGIESEVQVSASDLERWHERVWIDLGSVKNGYGWILPKRDHLSIGVWGPFASWRDIRVYYQRFMEKCRSEMSSYRVMKKRGHLLPVRKKGRPIHRDRLLLVGDAAGLIEPLSGEGIYYAVQSAQMAARAIRDYLSAVPHSSLAAYQAAVDSSLMADIQRAKSCQAVFQQLPPLSYAAFKRSGRMWQATCELIRGERRFADIGKTRRLLAFVLDRLDW